MGEMQNSKREQNELVGGFYETGVGGKGHHQPQWLGWISLTALFFFLGVWQTLLVASPTTVTLSSWDQNPDPNESWLV